MTLPHRSIMSILDRKSYAGFTQILLLSSISGVGIFYILQKRYPVMKQYIFGQGTSIFDEKQREYHHLETIYVQLEM